MVNNGVDKNVLILTKPYGYIEIGKLIGQTIPCWNGKEWSNTSFYEKDEYSSVYLIEFRNTSEIMFGEDHLWSVYVRKVNKCVKIPTRMLKIGDKLEKSNIDGQCDRGNNILPLAWVNGFISGDGQEYTNMSNNTDYRIYLYSDDKKKLLSKFEKMTNFYTYPVQHENIKERIMVYYNTEISKEYIKPKFFIPNTSYIKDSFIEWFAGLMDADGSNNIIGKGKYLNQVLRLTNINKKFLQRIMFRLNELGIECALFKDKDENYRDFNRFDNKGNLVKIESVLCNSSYMLNVATLGVDKLYKLGYNNYAGRVKIDVNILNNTDLSNAKQKYQRIMNITKRNTKEKVCFGIEPKRHMLVYNGVLSYDGEI